MAISPGPPRPGRAAALDLAEGVKGWAADRASLCSQLVDLGKAGEIDYRWRIFCHHKWGAQGGGRNLSME